MAVVDGLQRAEELGPGLRLPQRNQRAGAEEGAEIPANDPYRLAPDDLASGQEIGTGGVYHPGIRPAALLVARVKDRAVQFGGTARVLGVPGELNGRELAGATEHRTHLAVGRRRWRQGRPGLPQVSQEPVIESAPGLRLAGLEDRRILLLAHRRRRGRAGPLRLFLVDLVPLGTPNAELRFAGQKPVPGDDHALAAPGRVRRLPDAGRRTPGAGPEDYQRCP